MSPPAAACTATTSPHTQQLAAPGHRAAVQCRVLRGLIKPAYARVRSTWPEHALLPCPALPAVRFVETYHKWNTTSVTMPPVAEEGHKGRKGHGVGAPAWGGPQPWLPLDH